MTNILDLIFDSVSLEIIKTPIFVEKTGHIYELKNILQCKVPSVINTYRCPETRITFEKDSFLNENNYKDSKLLLDILSASLMELLTQNNLKNVKLNKTEKDRLKEFNQYWEQLTNEEIKIINTNYEIFKQGGEQYPFENDENVGKKNIEYNIHKMNKNTFKFLHKKLFNFLICNNKSNNSKDINYKFVNSDKMTANKAICLDKINKIIKNCDQQVQEENNGSPFLFSAFSFRQRERNIFNFAMELFTQQTIGQDPLINREDVPVITQTSSEETLLNNSHEENQNNNNPSQEEGEINNTSALYWLCSQNNRILNSLLEQNPNIVETISVEALLNNPQEENQNNNNQSQEVQDENNRNTQNSVDNLFDVD